MNNVTITMPPGIDIDDIEQICHGVSRWCDWAQDHDLIHPVKIIVTSGPPMTRSELLRSVLDYLPLRHADDVRITPAVAHDPETVDHAETTTGFGMATTPEENVNAASE